MSYVLVRSTKKDKAGNLVRCSLNAPLVPGGQLVWDKSNDFTEKVPLVLTYVTSMGEKKVVAENWAQEILNNYRDEFGLELVEIVTPPVVTQPVETKRGPGRPRKEKENKDEEAAV